MTIYNVPSEILEDIFQLLPDTRECMLVCKGWYITALRIFYSNVKLTSSNNASKFIGYNQYNGIWVRYLNLAMDTMTIDEFKTLVYQVNHVKMIHFDGIGKQSIESLLESLLTIQDLKYIKEIKVAENLSIKARELHFLACFNYRETITNLNLNNFRSRYTMNNISGNCLDFLPQFKQLTKLTIHNDLLHGDRYMLISTVLDACPKLSDFKLVTKRYFPDGSKPGLLKMMDDNDTNKKKKEIQRMEFHLHDFHQGYIKYLILYTKLHYFKLHLINIDIHDWLMDKQQDMNSFTEYLSKVNNVEIITESILSKRNQQQQQQDKMKRHWEFLTGIIGKEKKINCHVYLSMKNGYDNDEQMFKLNKSQDKMVIEYELKPEYPTNNLLSLFNIDDNKNNTCIIHSIEIGNATRYRIEDCLELIQFIFKKCLNIKYILLIRSTLCFRFEAIEYPFNIHFDSIQFNIHLKSTMERLNHVLLKDTILSTELMQVLCSPHIVVLKFSECTLPTLLDLTHIKHLYYLEINSCIGNHFARILSNQVDSISIQATSCTVVQT